MFYLGKRHMGHLLNNKKLRLMRSYLNHIREYGSFILIWRFLLVIFRVLNQLMKDVKIIDHSLLLCYSTILISYGKMHISSNVLEFSNMQQTILLGQVYSKSGFLTCTNLSVDIQMMESGLNVLAHYFNAYSKKSQRISVVYSTLCTLNFKNNMDSTHIQLKFMIA